jgi:uncharacterized membrane protein YphA (DoxX/SURF4 family)
MEGRHTHVDRSVPSELPSERFREPESDEVLDKPEMHEKGRSNMSARTSTMATLLLKEDALLKLKMIGYWATTTVVALELLAGGVTDLVHGRTELVAGEPVVEVLAHLGYPVYLLRILGVWKLPAGIALLAPRFPRLKEWAYAGAFFVYTGAAASGVVRGRDDPGTHIWPPLIFAVLTLASWALRPPSRTLGGLFPAKTRA